MNAADRNGYRIRFFHLEMWHFPNERSQHSRMVNGVVRLHNRPGDQTHRSQGACKPQRATGSGKRLCVFKFEGNFPVYDGPLTDTLTDTLPIDLQPSATPCNRVIYVISCQTSTRAPAFTPSQCFLIAMARRL